MPYVANTELPPRIRDHLPEHAQDIFREAFNHAWARYANDPRREEIAFRVAWSAVKKAGYRKLDGEWG
jgi:cation transport regulator